MIFFILAGVLITGACAYLQHPKFSRPLEDRRLDSSPHFVNGKFHNLLPTPMFTDDSSLMSVLFSSLFKSRERLTPEFPIPTLKTDLNALDRNRDTVIWLGHSSYFMQLAGKRILIDPVFSTNAAPVPNTNVAFEGSSLYTAEDMPQIDYLLITHDHWDHLDYASVKALASRTRNVICGLGVGSYFERWGYAKEKIHEADWFTALALEKDLTIHVLPARHYSGRLLAKNKTLWVGYALETPSRRIMLSGDSGYGPHFSEIGQSFGGFDLAILDSGQYDRKWAYIHMMPEQAAQAAEELKANALLPGHVGKFSIANHPWDEPFERIAEASRGKSYRLLTPLIGEPVLLADEPQRFSRWWEDVESPALVRRSQP